MRIALSLSLHTLFGTILHLSWFSPLCQSLQEQNLNAWDSVEILWIWSNGNHDHNRPHHLICGSQKITGLCKGSPEISRMIKRQIATVGSTIKAFCFCLLGILGLSRFTLKLEEISLWLDCVPGLQFLNCSRRKLIAYILALNRRVKKGLDYCLNNNKTQKAAAICKGFIKLVCLYNVPCFLRKRVWTEMLTHVMNLSGCLGCCVMLSSRI